MPQIFENDKHPEWIVLDRDFSLDKTDARERTNRLPEQSGVYLWTVVRGGSEYAMYVGKANSIRRRIYSYTQSFQPHSPNDRKLYFAQAAIAEANLGAAFPLYWRQVEPLRLNNEEVISISTLKPILNDRSRYTQDHKEKLESAYRDLYLQLVRQHFAEA